MKTQSLIISAFLFSLFFVSCTKDNTPATKTGLLTKAPWILKKIEKKEPAGAYTDQPLHDCEKDDLLSFNKDYSIKYVINTSCSAYDTAIGGTWSFSSAAENELMVSFDGDSFTGAIQTLDDNNFIMVYLPTGYPYLVKTSYTH